MEKLRGDDTLEIVYSIGKKRFDPYSKGGWPYTSVRHWHKLHTYTINRPDINSWATLKSKIMSDFENYLDKEIDILNEMRKT
jgi:hypothetical protein